MRILLYGLIGFQVLIGLWFSVTYLVAGDRDWSVLAIFFYTYIAHAVIFVIAAITAWINPAVRKLCFVAMALPFAILILAIAPPAIRGQFFTLSELGAFVLFLAVASIAYAFLRPGRTGGKSPKELRRSKAVNWLVLLAQIASWVVPIGIIVAYIASVGGSGNRDGTGVYVILLFFAAAGAVIGVVAMLALLWSLLCLRSLPAGSPRGLNIMQSVLAVPSLLVTAAIAWLYFQSVS